MLESLREQVDMMLLILVFRMMHSLKLIMEKYLPDKCGQVMLLTQTTLMIRLLIGGMDLWMTSKTKSTSMDFGKT